MKKIYLTFLFITVGLLSVMPQTVRHAVAQEQAIWIDVRTQAEWDRGHLEKAILIPYQEIGQRISEVTTDKSQLIYLYCRSGNRSGIATQILTELGFNNVENRGAYETLRE